MLLLLAFKQELLTHQKRGGGIKSLEKRVVYKVDYYLSLITYLAVFFIRNSYV